ncbi:MAG TPA: DUF885 family protein, partial [Pseudoxanthomonas sp.]|nr:DUF885 family protein [Pseudoxanthomonas sp.]
MFRLLLLTLAALAAVPPAYAQASPDRNPALHALFAEEWEGGLRQSPENASYSGDRRYNDRWTDFSLEAIASRAAADRAALQKLQAIDRGALSAADRLDYDTFLWQLQRSVERQRFREYLQPLSHQGGPQTLDGIAEVLPFANAEDYRDWLARLRAVPAVLEQVTALMREGVKAGSVPPRILMQRVPAQIAAQRVDDPARSGFYRPFLKMPESIA